MSVANRPVRQRPNDTVVSGTRLGLLPAELKASRSLLEEATQAGPRSVPAPKERGDAWRRRELEQELCPVKLKLPSKGDIPALAALDPTDPNYMKQVYQATMNANFPAIAEAILITGVIQKDAGILRGMQDQCLGRPTEREPSENIALIRVQIDVGMNPFPNATGGSLSGSRSSQAKEVIDVATGTPDPVAVDPQAPPPDAKALSRVG